MAINILGDPVDCSESSPTVSEIKSWLLLVIIYTSLPPGGAYAYCLKIIINECLITKKKFLDVI